jgi:NADH-quinone oxidoreductase subunit N
MSTNLLAILPEVILTVAGILIMLAEPMLAPGKSRKPLGWVAIFGSIAAGAASFYQLHIVNAANMPVSAFYATVQVDDFSIFFHLLIASIVAVTLLGSLNYFDKPGSHAGEYFALLCFGATGMMFMTLAVELLMVFVGLEISSISTYILAGFRKGKSRSVEAALKYFLLGSFATAFFLYGIALLFGATGSTSIGAIAAALPHTAMPKLAFLAIAMLLIGLGFKVSAAPFHVWTPDVYQGAPAPVVGLLSTAPKAAAFAVLLRLLFNAAPSLREQWFPLICVLAVLSMFVGNLGALMQTNVKRMLAYSSIAHAGYLLCAFTSFHQDAVAAACFYTAAYAAMNVGAFLVLTQISGYDENARTLEDFTGLAQQRPALAALLGFFLLSLIGIPFTGGFFGKFYVFTAAVHGGAVWLAVIGLANSGIACFYYLRLLTAIYARPLGDSTNIAPTPRRLNIPAAIALSATAAATLFLGILPNRLLQLVRQATPETLPSATYTAPSAPPLPQTSIQH